MSSRVGGPRSTPSPQPQAAAAPAQKSAAKPVSRAQALAQPAPKSEFKAAVNDLLHLRAPHLSIPDELREMLHLYPSGADRSEREQQIAGKVAQMALSAPAQQALSLLSARGVSTVDIWQGSHVILDGDRGKLYDQLAQLPGVEARGSSHYPGVATQQYGLVLGKAELLFGKTPDGSTWIQTEAHAYHGPTVKTAKDFVEAWIHNPEHMLDWSKYVLSGKTQNVGPLGFSPHTEQHDPVRVASAG